jgi:hypothetical protein
MAVSRSGSFPVLCANHQSYSPAFIISRCIHSKDLICNLADDERTRVGLNPKSLSVCIPLLCKDAHSFVYTEKPIVKKDIRQQEMKTHRCPNPDRTFSRFLTASRKAGTLAGLTYAVSNAVQFTYSWETVPSNRDQHTNDSLVCTSVKRPTTQSHSASLSPPSL